MSNLKMPRLTAAAGGALACVLSLQAANAASFTPGDLVVSVEGNGGNTGSYTDNEAAPLTLYEFSTTLANQSPIVSLTLPQSQSGANYAVSGEYGSSSEGTLELSGNGQYLVIAGYGVNAKAFNADPAKYSSTGNPALAQSGSLTGQSYTPVPRVIAEININGQVNSTTALYNVFDQNNPRSVATIDGRTFYISGQGNYPDTTSGVFYATRGSHTATSITGNDACSPVTPCTSSQDTRTVEIYNDTLYVSTDSKKGSVNRDFIGTLGSPPATSLYNSGAGPTQLPGFGNNGGTGKVTITSGAHSNGNGLNAGKQINLSPSNFFFADADTLYVADTGSPKNSSATSSIGDGGLQKWSLVDGTWQLDYTLSAGLNLVLNTASAGTTGLYGLTGEDVTIGGKSEVELFATNSTITDTGQTYLYEITDVLADVANPGTEDFTVLATAPADSSFKGVSFAPTSYGAAPEPSTWAMMLIGFMGLAYGGYRRAKTAAALAA